MKQSDSEEYFCFLDEAGDHSLAKIDTDFPVFVLSVVFCKVSEYYYHINPAVNLFKYRYFNHEGIILHSRHIRKAIPPFAILQNATVRGSFMNELSQMMAHLNFETILCIIDKAKLLARYGSSANNPYIYAVKVILERLVHPIQNRNIKRIDIIAESRGKKEDDELELEMLRILKSGTEYRNSSNFTIIQQPIFIKKENNVAGLQIADLVAYPAGRYILNPQKQNLAFEIIKTKFLNNSEKYNLVLLP
ncbi:MAG: DUF3800 domain-containing protein [bacterium]